MDPRERTRKSAEAGQAAVESAIVLPMMVFLVLGVIQLAMLQHARLMTEYAAFNAVRAGIVWNGNQCMMRRAAVVSLLPTLAATDKLAPSNEPFGRQRPGLIQTWVMAEILVAGSAAAYSILDWLGLGDLDVRLIDVEILNPTAEDAEFFFRDGKEIDFDAVAGVPGGPDFECAERDPGGGCLGSGELMRRATVLTVRVNYLYPMRIPFANWMIFYSYLAHRAGRGVSGSFFRPGVDSQSIVRGSAIGTRTSGTMLAFEGGGLRGLDGELLASSALIALLWQIGNQTGVYLFPLHAVHSMRMQSNFYASSFEPAVLCIDY